MANAYFVAYLEQRTQHHLPEDQLLDLSPLLTHRNQITDCAGAPPGGPHKNTRAWIPTSSRGALDRSVIYPNIFHFHDIFEYEVTL